MYENIETRNVTMMRPTASTRWATSLKAMYCIRGRGMGMPHTGDAGNGNDVSIVNDISRFLTKGVIL